MTAIRFASYNASLNRNAAGQLLEELVSGDSQQASSVAEIIQRTAPDVLLINEFDFDGEAAAATAFAEDFLAVPQNGASPIAFPHVYVAASNTGNPSGFDLDNDGTVGGPGDALGFGFFEGQFSFAIFSRYEIDVENVRTFQTFLWKDMPGALLPPDPEDADGDGDLSSWYSEEELDVVRLSSKTHVDLPLLIDGEVVHVLASHPTPPVFDGPEDRNGRRNHDEIRFWADYVRPEASDYIYDDEGREGGLAAGARFVIMGDLNADPFDGDSVASAARQLLDHEAIIGSATEGAITPASAGGVAAALRQGGTNLSHQGDPAFDTADFGFAGPDQPDGAPGNLRVDYVLPSTAGFEIGEQGVFWLTPDDALWPLGEFPTSDHRLVFADAVLIDENLAAPGTYGDDRLKGSGGADSLYGKGGDDVLYGLGGNDILIGGTGDDVILGGGKGDLIAGGQGDDTLYGQSGNDLFFLGDDEGRDVVVGFTRGEDRMVLIGDGEVHFAYHDDGSTELTFGNAVVLFEGMRAEIGDLYFADLSV